MCQSEPYPRYPQETVDLVAAGLVDIMSEEIEDGKTVRLGDFGLFRPSFVGKCADTQEGVTASNIVRKRILFFPGKAFSAMLDKMSVTRMAMPDTDYTDGSQGNEGKPEIRVYPVEVKKRILWDKAESSEPVRR